MMLTPRPIADLLRKRGLRFETMATGPGVARLQHHGWRGPARRGAADRRAVSASLDESYVHCGALTREHMRDRWIGALFAPEDKRKHLHAIAAFAYETARIKALAKEPLAGEMRLTWWMEAVDGARDGEAASHPVAAALLATISATQLPKARFEDWLLARRDELYREAPLDAAAAHALESPLFALSALALGAEAEAAALPAGEAQVAMDSGRSQEALDANRSGRGGAQQFRRPSGVRAAGDDAARRAARAQRQRSRAGLAAADRHLALGQGEVTFNAVL